MDKNDNILIVGKGDVIETSLLSYFKEQGFENVTSARQEGLDPLDQSAVKEYFSQNTPAYVILGSVRSGGIKANQSFPAEFIYENTVAAANVIDAAYRSGVKKLLYLSASCVYPRECPQPMTPEHLGSGPLEPTSEAYSTAKLAGIRICQAYRKQYNFPAVVAIPATIYGPGMDYDEKNAHVMGALLKRFYSAILNYENEVVVWGTGEPKREFLFSRDFARACRLILEEYEGDEIVQIGCGEEINIMNLAELVAQTVGFTGPTRFDTKRPDGAPQKLLDSSVLKGLGWKAETSLSEGIMLTFQAMTADQ